MNTQLHTVKGAAVIIALLCFLGLIAIGLGSLSGHSARLTPVSESRPVPELEAKWRARIAEVGGAAAYREFARSVEALTVSEGHTRAHAFGGALYEVEGLQGLSVCDAQFSYGCFHEFLGRAIAEHGLSVVSELNEGCIKALVTSPLSCQHGIGHGIMGYLGYTFGDLERALAVCKDLPHNDPIGGCYGGVFMEYNMRTMLGEEGRARAVGDDDLQFPCDRLTEPYTNACYFWQPQWWHQVLKENDPDESYVYAKMGGLCASAPHSATRACYEGVGNNVPPDADFDAARVRALCEVTSSSPLNQLYCKSLAANSLFVGGAGKTGNAEAICAGLSSDALEYCLAYARNDANIFIQLPPPEIL